MATVADMPVIARDAAAAGIPDSAGVPDAAGREAAPETASVYESPSPEQTRHPAPVLRLLVKLTAFTVLATLFMLISIYCAGCYQDFPESTQFTLLRFIMFVSVMLVIAALSGALLDLVCALAYKTALPLAGTLGYVFLLLFGVFLAMAAGFITSVAEGNL